MPVPETPDEWEDWYGTVREEILTADNAALGRIRAENSDAINAAPGSLGEDVTNALMDRAADLATGGSNG